MSKDLSSSLEYNVQVMKQMMKAFPNVSVRPHVKAHKSPLLALVQEAAFGGGVCCQTFGEALSMVRNDEPIKDVLIANEIVNKEALKQIAMSSKSQNLSICVDSEYGIDLLSEAFTESNKEIDIVVEVNAGQNRCGVESGAAAASLAKYVTSKMGLNFKGIQCYNGINQHVYDHEERHKAVLKVSEIAKDAKAAIEEAGIPCNYVTGGGTGTFEFEAASGVFTEIQPGSFIFMDVDYNNVKTDKEKPHFKQSLFIVSSVISVSPGRFVVDCGTKDVSLDSGPPVVHSVINKNVNVEGMKFTSGGDNHGIVHTTGDSPSVGDRVLLIPGHCDPTVNLYNRMHLVDDDGLVVESPKIHRCHDEE